jgi:ribosome recycling factor
MQQEINELLKSNFEQTYSALKRDLTRVRTGRANANLLDGVRVDYYGSPTPVSQVAAIQIPEARLVTIKPWEANLLGDIERAIINANLGLSPSNDGTVIRLNIPPLTEERRKELARQVQQLGETAKVSARNHRRDANADLKTLQKDGDLSEDELAKALKDVQGLTDSAIKMIDEILATKQAELEEI